MDADFETRLAARLREELAEAVPDDLVPPLLPEAAPARWRRLVVPLVAAASVAALAVGIIVATRPDRAAPVAATPTVTTAASTATSWSVSPDPNVFWVPMTEEQQERARALAAAWNGTELATTGEQEPVDVPSVWVVSVISPDQVMLHGSGAPPGTGLCQEQQLVSVLETSETVVIHVQPRPKPPAPSVTTANGTVMDLACVAMAYAVEMPVQLSAPLADRAVLYLNRWELIPVAEPGCFETRGMLCAGPGG